jgi:outer membrane lipoprotein carrier protein
MQKGLQILIVTILSVSFLAPALAAKEAGTSSTWEVVSQKYRSAALTKMDMEKTVKSEFSGDKVFEGQMFLSSGLFRMEIQKPEKSMIVFDGKNLWSEQAPNADFGGKAQVTKAKIDKKNGTQLLVTKVFEKGVLQKLFKIESEKTTFDEKYKHDITLIKAVPKTKDISLKLLILGVDPDKQVVTEIGYIDDIDNQTIMRFSNIEFKTEKDRKLFQYKPPKDAQVTDL